MEKDKNVLYVMNYKYTILVVEDEVFGKEKIKEMYWSKGCVFIGALSEKAFDKFNEFHDELLENE